MGSDEIEGVFQKFFLSLIPSGRSHLSRCFWKNLQKFCCCAGIRLLPLQLLHVWKPFCDPLTYSQWERHFLSSFQKNSAHLTHIWKPFCQPIRRGFLLQFLTATFATEKRHDFWKNFPSTLYRNFRSRKTTHFPKLFQKSFLLLYRKFFRSNLNPYFKNFFSATVTWTFAVLNGIQISKKHKNSACLVFRSRRYIFSSIQL